MSEDYDDTTDGPISIDRAKHHCRRLAVDCGWRAMEVQMHIDDQAEMMALLRAEVKAWRTGWYDDDASDGELARARAATDEANALEDK